MEKLNLDSSFRCGIILQMVEENNRSIETINATLVGEIFDRAKSLLSEFGKDSSFGRTPGQKLVNLNVDDPQDLRGHTRINVCGDLQGDEVEIMYNSTYFRGSYLFTTVRLNKNKVTFFQEERSEEAGDATRVYPHHGILPPKHPKTFPNLTEVRRLLGEGKVDQGQAKSANKKPLWKRILTK